MKRFLFLLVLFILTIPSYAQIEEKYIEYDKYGVGKMPFNDEGEVVFEKVINCDSLAKAQIYSASKLFLSNGYEIITDDADNYILVALGVVKAPIPKGFSITDGLFDKAEIHFRLRIQCRDNRYKMTISSIKGRIPSRIVSGITIKEILIDANDLTDEKCVDTNGKLKGNGMFWRMSIIDASTLLPNSIELGINQEVCKIYKENW